MGATLSVSVPVLSCLLMRDGLPPLHVRVEIGADSVRLCWSDGDDDGSFRDVPASDLAQALRDLAP